MNKKTLNKTVLKSFRESKGRFLSIMLLMMLGSMTLIALKVTGDDIDKTANKYYEEHNLSDVNVVCNYGISKNDVRELSTKEKLKDIECGHFTDVTIDNTPQAFRIFSKTKNISEFELVKGRFPQKIGEIALTDQYSGVKKINDTIVIKEKDEDSKILKQEKFTITGFVNSSEIISKTALGNSSAGSGSLEGYGVVSDENFDSEVYTIVRMRFDDLRGLNYTDPKYVKRVEQHQKVLDEMLKDNGKSRLNEIKKKANEKISKSKKKIADAKKELEDAQKKLNDGQQKLNEEKSKLDSSKKQLANKEYEIKSSRYQISSAEETLEVTKKQLDDAKILIANGQKQLDSKKPEVEENRNKLSKAKSTLDSNKKKLDESLNQINQGKSQIANAKKELENKKSGLTKQGIIPENVPEISQSSQAIAQQELVLKQSKAKYNEGLTEYDQGLKKYQDGMKKIDEFDKSQNQLNQKKKLYEDGISKYNSGLQQLNASKKKYQNGLVQIKSAKSKIQTGYKTISSKQEELNDKKKTFVSEKKKAQDKIQDSESKIADAQKDIDGLSIPEYSTFTRRTMPGGDGIKLTETTSSGIRKVSNLFPVVLYLVAALVTVTTMTRFVQEERNNAGILKALGYNDYDVIKKFVVYGLVSGILGTIFGTILGMYALPYVLCSSLLQNMTLPAVKYHFFFKIFAVSIICSLISSVLPAVYISTKELKESASQLLLPKPPTKGSKILLERIKPLWNRMSFTHKVTARNIFRYKQRMLMTIFGVAGSVALLFAGLGIASSINGIRTKQFGEIIQYDAVVAKKDSLNKTEQEKIDKLLKSDSIQDYTPIHSETVTKKIKGIEDEQTISMLVTNSHTFSPFINLEHRKSTDKLKITDDGIVISEKLADISKRKIGDTITVNLSDNETKKLKINNITKMYAGHFIFMNDKYYAKSFAKKANDNSYFITLKNNRSTDNIKKVAAQFMKLNKVKGVQQNTNTIKQVDTIILSLTKVMTVLTIMSLLLAIVILYNLTNINLQERIRELSTIKVLGFFNKEVTMYIYRETICLSLIGIIVGIFGGKLLHKIILEKVAPAEIMFNPHIETWVYIAPVILVVAILYLLEIVVNHKLKKVDMLEALKSVE
ncbi:FtsX-like permease family protein [uncultured Finegoldia sp.]|uniref:FtsX-like permease family protein n=1 Tax=uncultured Finegoldia sp. TaxID=328009 RepID=UPI00262BE3DC|nr:FtsX-like permease family protein [uncultured Finegoldia sp.]